MSRECSAFLQRALASRCGVVDTAGGVEQAGELLRRRLYDLIVLDIAFCPVVPGGD